MIKKRIGTIDAPEKPNSIPKESQWLFGQGAGVWFYIETTENSKYRIKRFTPRGSLDCDRVFEIEENGSIFDINITYEFAQVSHCAKCRVKQNEIIFVFNYIKLKR